MGVRRNDFEVSIGDIFAVEIGRRWGDADGWVGFVALGTGFGGGGLFDWFGCGGGFDSGGFGGGGFDEGFGGGWVKFCKGGGVGW